MTQRRDFLKTALAGGLATIGFTGTAAAKAYPKTPESKPSGAFRILHLTDIHIRPEYEAPRRFTRIVNNLMKSAGKIDLILNGGDVIYAADYNHITRERVLEQWEIFDQTIKPVLGDIEMLSALGNHDMWWAGPKGDAMLGKDYVLKRLGQKSRYASIERGGWLIVTLDANHGAHLDQEQLEWLHAEQKNNPDKPMLVMSHQPLLEVESVFKKGVSPRQQEIISPFLDHSVQARPVHFLSGHIHILDTLGFKNLNFHCNGALSGSWWEPHIDAKDCSVMGTPMGYGIIDLYPDGQFRNVYHDVTDCQDGKIIV